VLYCIEHPGITGAKELWLGAMVCEKTGWLGRLVSEITYYVSMGRYTHSLGGPHCIETLS